MMNQLEIKQYEPGDEYRVHALVRQVYDEFVAPDYTDEGNCTFYAWIAPARIAERQRIQTCLWMALVADRVVGVLEIRNENHLCLLFVNRQCQGQGIAKKLFAVACDEMLYRNPQLKEVTVNASPYAVRVYERLGFTSAGSKSESDGIIYYPMVFVFGK